MEHSVFKYVLLKKKNRRVDIIVYRSEDGDDITFCVNTKRLVGDWKDRNILELRTIYGYESIVAIMASLDMVLQDIDFKKVSNRLNALLSKDRYSVVARNTNNGKSKK